MDNKAKLAKAIEIRALSQAFVTATSPRDGYSIIQPMGKPYDDHQLLTANGVANAESNSPFWILIANLGRYPKTLAKNQVVATLLAHPTITVPTHVLLANVVEDGNLHSSDTWTGTKGLESNDNTPFGSKQTNWIIHTSWVQLFQPNRAHHRHLTN